MFACSPNRSDDYMNIETAESICSMLYSKGFESLHIGGGEPFLNFDKLLKIVDVVKKSGLLIEYVETNGFWMSNDTMTKHYLAKLHEHKVERLLISLDAFHVEHIPINLPLRLAELCHEYEIKPIVWRKQFEQELRGLDLMKTYTRNELEKQLSPTYIYDTAKVYGLQPSGRAINIEKEYSPYKLIDEIIATPHPCHNLRKTDAMHLDLYGNYLVSWCVAMAIPFEEAVGGISKGKYKIFETLLSEGVAGLLEYANAKGFKPDDYYTSSCALCFHIRHWLSENGNYPELYPDYFREALLYY